MYTNVTRNQFSTSAIACHENVEMVMGESADAATQAEWGGHGYNLPIIHVCAGNTQASPSSLIHCSAFRQAALSYRVSRGISHTASQAVPTPGALQGEIGGLSGSTGSLSHSSRRQNP